MIDIAVEESKVPLYCIITCDQKCISGMYDFGFLFAIIFAGITTIVSLYNIFMHYINFNNPFFQAKIIVLLLLPPIFSITATFSFFSFKLTTYLTVGRTVYQIFALFAFFQLLFSYLGFQYDKDCLNERKVYEIMKNESSQIQHEFPCSYFQKPYQISNWRKAKYFSHRCKRVMLQYLVAKIAASLLFLSFQTASDWNYNIPDYVNQLIYWITAISSYIAYYYINLLYNCLKKPLKAYKPDLKFFVITLTVFFVFWQTICFAIFQKDIIACFDNSSPSFQQHRIIHELEHILICVQMLILSFICVETFSYEGYVTNRKRLGSISYVIRDALTLFFTELRIIKPRIYRFAALASESETELQTITKSLKRQSKATYQFKVNTNIEECTKQDYF